jgi:hypothetical protein
MIVYCTRLWFQPNVALQAPVSVVARWLSKKTGRVVKPDHLLAGVDRTYDGGHRVRSIGAVGQFPQVLAISYSHPDSSTSGRQWFTELGLKQEDKSTDVDCTVLVKTEEISARVTTPVLPSRPGVVTELVNRCALSPRTQGVSSHSLDDRSGEAFRHVVLDPTRQHALVVLSPSADGEYLTDPGKLSSMLLGLADIVTIPPGTDTFWLARVVGKEFIPYRGAIKIIFPAGRRIDSGPPPTRFMTPQEALDLKAAGKQVLDELFSVVVHRSNLPLSWVHLSLQAAKDTRIRRDLAQKREEAAKSGDLQELNIYLEECVTQLEGEKKQLEGTIEALEKLNEAQEDRERKLMYDLDSLKHRLSDAERSGRGSAGPEDDDTGEVAEAILAVVESEPTPERCLKILEFLFPERVVILPSAWQSARKSGRFRYGIKLYGLLHLLLTEYWSSLCAGTPDGDARKVFGNAYAAKESEGVANNSGARDRRTFQYGNDQVEMMKHLKIGVKDSLAETIRVHFEWFPDEQRIVIGHCGEHIPFK